MDAVTSGPLAAVLDRLDAIRDLLAAAARPLALLLSIADLGELLSRSVAALERDEAGGRLPAPVWVGGSKRYRRSDIEQWVAWGCPPRAEYEARQRAERR
jgi:hypothetical protein